MKGKTGVIPIKEHLGREEGIKGETPDPRWIGQKRDPPTVKISEKKQQRKEERDANLKLSPKKKRGGGGVLRLWSKRKGGFLLGLSYSP